MFLDTLIRMICMYFIWTYWSKQFVGIKYFLKDMTVKNIYVQVANTPYVPHHIVVNHIQSNNELDHVFCLLMTAYMCGCGIMLCLFMNAYMCVCAIPLCLLMSAYMCVCGITLCLLMSAYMCVCGITLC